MHDCDHQRSLREVVNRGAVSRDESWSARNLLPLLRFGGISWYRIQPDSGLILESMLGISTLIAACFGFRDGQQSQSRKQKTRGANLKYWSQQKTNCASNQLEAKLPWRGGIAEAFRFVVSNNECDYSYSAFLSPVLELLACSNTRSHDHILITTHYLGALIFI